ncbi:hypothetical protein [Sphingomonas lenta]|nr:hypothetical protein [Sphingomonas lenta]
MAILMGLLASTAPAQKIDIAARILPPRATPGEALRPYLGLAA